MMPPPRTSIESLLQHSDWVRALARQLVRDDHRAADLVQQTWVNALEHPPREQGRPRSWLASVMRRVLYRMRREDQRRTRRERAMAIDESHASAAEVVEQAAAHRRVVDAVMQLDEPFRSTILLRFFRDLSTQEIAAQLGVAEATVRTRLHRGLKRLREQLEDTHGADWALTLLPVARTFVRRELEALSLATAGGIALMTMKAKVLVAGVLVIGAAATAPFVISARTRRAIAEQVPVAATQREAMPTPAEASRTALVASEGPANVAPSGALQATPAGLVLRGRLLEMADDAPWRSELHVSVKRRRESPSDAMAANGTVDPQGSFAIDVTTALADPQVESVILHGDDPGYMPFEAEVNVRNRNGFVPDAPAVFEHDVRLVRSGILTGGVVDEAGTPVSNAAVAVYLMRDGAPVDHAISASPCDAEGRYQLRIAHEGEFVIIAAVGARVVSTQDRQGRYHDGVVAARCLLPAAARVHARAGVTTVVEDLCLEPGVSISGRVMRNGVPLPGAIVQASRVVTDALATQVSVLQHEVLWAAGQVSSGGGIAITDESGCYRREGLSPGSYSVRVTGLADAWMHMSFQGEYHTVPAPSTNVDFDLAMARLDLCVTTPGSPARKAYVEVTHGGTHALETDDDGRVSLIVEPSKSYTITVDVAGCEKFEQDVTIPASATEHRIDIMLQPKQQHASLVLRISDEAGQPTESAWVRFTPIGAARSFERTAHLADGRFRFDDLALGSYAVEVRAATDMWGSESLFLPVQLTCELTQAGECSRAVTVRPGGRIRIRARDAEGQLVQAPCRVRDDAGREIDVEFCSRQARARTCLVGESEVGAALPPGRYEVILAPKGSPTRVVPVLVELGKTTEVDVRLEE